MTHQNRVGGHKSVHNGGNMLMVPLTYGVTLEKRRWSYICGDTGITFWKWRTHFMLVWNSCGGYFSKWQWQQSSCTVSVGYPVRCTRQLKNSTTAFHFKSVKLYPDPNFNFVYCSKVCPRSAWLVGQQLMLFPSVVAEPNTNSPVRVRI